MKRADHNSFLSHPSSINVPKCLKDCKTHIRKRTRRTIAFTAILAAKTIGTIPSTVLLPKLSLVKSSTEIPVIDERFDKNVSLERSS